MNKYLYKIIEKHGPKENGPMVEGMAYWQDLNNRILNYLDVILQSFSNNTPEGLEYIGLEEVSPEDQVIQMILKPSKKVHEITKSDLRLVKIIFNYNGNEIIKYINIPHIKRGGIIRFNGAKYYVMPVITDYVISLVKGNIFIRLNKDKINIERKNYTIIVNGRIKTGDILSPKINYSRQDNIGKGSPAIPLLTHYLLSKYGYEEMCLKYLDFVPEIIETKDKLEYSLDYTIIESTGTPPSKQISGWVPNYYKIKIPKSKYSPLVVNIVSELIYLLDHFSVYINNMEQMNDPNVWKILLGHVYYSPEIAPNVLLHNINDHLSMIETYIDPIIISKLEDRGYKIKNFYDLLVVILNHIQEWTKNYKEINESVYYRYMDVLYYIMYDIMESINTGANALNHKMKKKGELTQRDVETVLNKHLTIRKPYKLVNTRQPNISMMGIEYCGDNLYPKITAMVTLQECGEGVKKKKKFHSVPDRVKTINGTEILVGSLFYLNKKLPTPLIRLNPFCTVNPISGKIEPDNKYREKINKLHKLLTFRADEREFDVEIEIDNLENELDDL